MKILYGYKDLEKQLKDPIIAIGIFDGIHLGHKRVISRVLNKRQKNRDKTIVTFDPHPDIVLKPHKKLPRIMSLDHRLHIFEQMGIDAVLVLKFSDHISKMSPEDFIKNILKKTGTREIYVGENFHFGCGKSGDVNTFREVGKKYGIEVNKVRSIKKSGKVVSSTILRKLIASGKIERAERFLTRPVSILGTVVSGDKIGEKLGAPTANIDPHHEVIPPPGVYASMVDVGGKLYSGVINIGFKPTFYGRRLKRRKEPRIEVHIIGFKGNLYGKMLEIFFIKRMRREKKFKNEKLLISQIRRDIEKTGLILKEKEARLKRICRYKGLKG